MYVLIHIITIIDISSASSWLLPEYLSDLSGSALYNHKYIEYPKTRNKQFIIPSAPYLLLLYDYV